MLGLMVRKPWGAAAANHAEDIVGTILRLPRRQESVLVCRPASRFQVKPPDVVLPLDASPAQSDPMPDLPDPVTTGGAIEHEPLDVLERPFGALAIDCDAGLGYVSGIPLGLLARHRGPPRQCIPPL